MSNCNFSIPYSGDPSAILAKARSAVESQNGLFNGDNTSGNFEVSLLSNSVKGSYNVNGSLLNITIFSKPFFVPCSAIESFLKSKIS